MQGLNFQVDAAPIQQIPVAKASAEYQGCLASLVALVQTAYRSEEFAAAIFLEDLIDACVMECYFKEHMAERGLLFLDELAPKLAAYNPYAPESQQREFIVQLHGKLNSPSSIVRNRLLRISADSPDLLAVIKEGSRA